MDSGEISKDEIMREAGDMLKKMKEMGGGNENFQEMFNNLAKTMGGKGAKIDVNALERMTKQHDIRERMRNKLNKKKENFVIEKTNNPNNYVFKLPDEGEQPRSSLPPAKPLTDEELIAAFDKDTTTTNAPVKKSSKSGKKKKGGKK